MMHGEVEEEVIDGFAEVIFLDEIEYLLGIEEWSQLKISPLEMVPQQSRKLKSNSRFIFCTKNIWYGGTIGQRKKDHYCTSIHHVLAWIGATTIDSFRGACTREKR